MKHFLVLSFYLSCSYSAISQLDWSEVDIPMSDGEFLSGDVYLPPNWESGPVILIQTPYWKDLYHVFGLPLGIFYNQDEMEYAIVVVDWRGFFGSASAAYAGAPSRGEDGYDVVEWIASQSWSDGKIGTWGPSALGRVQFLTAREHPPHLVCIAPQVASPLYSYGEYYENGVARTEYLEQLDFLGFGTSPVIYANPYYNNLWTITENLNDYPDEIDVPVFMAGGWYDHNIDVMIKTFQDLQTVSPAAVQAQHKILMGPWVHGGSGSAIVGSATQGELEYEAAVGWSDSLAFEFFDYYLKGIDNGWNDIPPVTYFQMGDDEWRQAATIPIETNIATYYLGEDFVLNNDLPAEDGELEFQYNPEDPSPTVGGPTLRTDLDQGPFDQSDPVESRDDILVFSTQPLMQDIEVMGKARVKLLVQTDVPDTDIAVRLCDVYPDGRSMLVNCSIHRLRFLNGFTASDEQFLTSGSTYEVEIELPHTAITFKEGHRIRLGISGSNYPLYNRNMNTGGEMYPDGNGDTLVNPVVAHNKLILQPDNATSRLELPVVDAPTILVSESELLDELFIYPNPSAGEFLVSCQNGFYGVLRLCDAKGQLIRTIDMKRTQVFVDWSDLTPGLYHLSCTAGNKTVTKSLVIR